MSTSDALIDKIVCSIAVSQYTDALEKCDKCSIVSIDLKAFDTIYHSILIKKLHVGCLIVRKLHIYGNMDTALNLIISFLNNRKQYVNIHDVNYTFLDINCGIPQGSVLGPLLFLIYINDMTNMSNKVKIILFADDTNLIFSDNTIYLEHIMQEYLDILYEWLCLNKLSINIQKSRIPTAILYNIRNSLSSIRFNITINNMPI